MVRALARLDKSTAIIVMTCWIAAFVMLIFADVAVQNVASSKKTATETIALEPALPQVTTVAISPDEIQSIFSRLQHQFPNLKIQVDADQRLDIKSDDGADFNQWISALGYVEILAPQFHWALYEFCVGSCGEKGLMSAVVSGQNKGFSLPAH